MGGIFYSRRIMGARVVSQSPPKEIVLGHQITNFGCHANQYEKEPYFTVAAAIGMETEEIDVLIEKLG